jgi:hypothetical protein
MATDIDDSTIILAITPINVLMTILDERKINPKISLKDIAIKHNYPQRYVAKVVQSLSLNPTHESIATVGKPDYAWEYERNRPHIKPTSTNFTISVPVFYLELIDLLIKVGLVKSRSFFFKEAFYAFREKHSDLSKQFNLQKLKEYFGVTDDEI